MKRQKTYERFIADDFQQIKSAFQSKGLNVESSDDFSTYDGWLEQGRKVKTGRTALKLKSSKTYPTPIFKNGGRSLDDKGKQRFGKFQTEWCLFHKDETTPINGG